MSNFDLPDEAELFVHRVGRTGRAGRSGTAISLVTPSERRMLREIEHFTKQEMRACNIPTPEEPGQAPERPDDQDYDVVWRGRAKEEHALVEGLVADGADPLETLAAVALKIARAEEKQRPIASISPLPEKAARLEGRPHPSAGSTRRGAGRQKLRAHKPRYRRAPRPRTPKDSADHPRRLGWCAWCLAWGAGTAFAPAMWSARLLFTRTSPAPAWAKSSSRTTAPRLMFPRRMSAKCWQVTPLAWIMQQEFQPSGD